MADTFFFATYGDLLPILLEAEVGTAVQYALSSYGTAAPPVYLSARDIPARELSEGSFLVMHRRAEYKVEQAKVGNEGAASEYEVTLPDEQPHFYLAGSHIIPNRCIVRGWASTGQEYTDESYALYRMFATPLRRGLRQIGYLYGAEALRLGSTGLFYAFGESDLIPPRDSWTFQDIEAILRDDQAILPRTERIPLAATWNVLEQIGYEPPRNAEGQPALPSRPPGNPESDEDDLAFFRTSVDAEEFSHLTMPRTFFARTQIERTLFRNTDLSESFMCWNDWLDCDFSGADLTGADMRAGRYLYCTFASANLTGADLRQSSFINCDFTNTRMQGTKMRREQATIIPLSADQMREIAWRKTDRQEPPWG